MNSIIKKILRNLRILKKEPRKFITGSSKILEIGYGHYNSFQLKQSVNPSSQALPWFTYPAIEFLNQFDFSEKSMLEWGCGNSSKWFSEKVKILYSIEHNEEWFNVIRADIKKNQHLILAQGPDYVNAAKGFGFQFDIILIDGIEREKCVRCAIQLMCENGLIILDNSDRYPDLSQTLRDTNLIQIDFHGFGPINEYTWTTSLFLSRSVLLKPLTIQPRIPIGGGF